MSINAAIREIFGEDVTVVSSSRISGGDINEASMLVLSNGERVFIKSNKAKGIDFFEAEAGGLSAIGDTKAIAVPKVLRLGKDPERGTFLILEYIESAPKVEGYWQTFAEDLASMHKADTSEFVAGGLYGFSSDNYIGSREQINTPYDSWIDFFRDCRLIPRFEGADEYFDTTMKRSINRLLDNLDKWLTEPEQPSLLHGDLWSGNAITGSDGRAMLIDPAVYVGHAEADLAMTELFGGFSNAFYRAYAEFGLVTAGYEDRRDIYNLYHLLNHLISFGRSYFGAVVRIVKYYAG